MSFDRRNPDDHSSFGVQSKRVDFESQADVRSTYSDTSNISAVPISNRGEGTEDTSSTAVLAGSFSSAMITYTGNEDSSSNLWPCQLFASSSRCFVNNECVHVISKQAFCNGNILCCIFCVKWSSSFKFLQFSCWLRFLLTFYLFLRVFSDLMTSSFYILFRSRDRQLS